MKKLIFVCAALALLTFCLTGCGDLKNKVVGTWKIDASTIKGPALDQMEALASTIPSQKKIADHLVAIIKSMSMSFKDDGTCALTATSEAGQSEAGTWDLKDHTITINFKDSANKNNPTLTLNEDGSKIHMSVGDTGQNTFEADFVKSSK